MIDREQLTDVCKALDIQIKSVRIAFRPDGGGFEGAADWYVFLRRRRDGHPMTDHDWVPFGCYSAGAGHKDKRGNWLDPKVANVLGSLASDAQGADQKFAEWSRDLGFDMKTHADHKHARKTWKACRRTRKLLASWLGEHFDRVLNAEH